MFLGTGILLVLPLARGSQLLARGSLLIGVIIATVCFMSGHTKSHVTRRICLATCNAAMTTEKRCKLQRGCHTFAPAGNCLQLFLRSPARKILRAKDALCLAHYENCVALKLRLTCHAQHVSPLCEKLRIVLLSLQLATQHFVALQVVNMGVTREIFLSTCNARFVTTP